MTDRGVPFRVLCVEDDRITAMLFAEALRTCEGVEVRLAEDAEAALEAVTGWRPDLMVVDAHLPGASGIDLLAPLRQRMGTGSADAGGPPGADTALSATAPPAYLCSADDDAALARRAVDAGFQAFWTKPVQAKRWRELVQGLQTETFNAPGAGGG